MKRPEFASEEIYHVYNRGVEKRDVFLNEWDYTRFIHGLFEFNDTHPAISSNVKLSARHRAQELSNTKLQPYPEVQPRGEVEPPDKRELLVDILAFCLMPNHFHLLLQQKRDNGIVKFMQKLGTGYTMYFNKKYDRSVLAVSSDWIKAIVVKYIRITLGDNHFEPVVKQRPWRMLPG